MISLYEHFSKPHSYIAWNGDNLLGEVVEDDIMKILDKEQVIDLYHRGKSKFKVCCNKMNKFLIKPDKNDK